MTTCIRIALVMAFIIQASAAQMAPSAIPAGGHDLLGAEAMAASALEFYGREFGSDEIIQVEGMPFSKARRLHTTLAPKKFYHIGVRQPLPAINPGSILLVTFWARCVGGGDNDKGTGQITISIQDRDSWQVAEKYIAAPGHEWQRFDVPVELPPKASIKGYQVGIAVGALIQSVEIADLRIINYENRLTKANLPITFVTYAGRELDAPWRTVAAERIERHRKGDLTVTVVDAAGKPVPHAKVAIRMQRHAFQFGAAITSRAFMNDPEAEAIRAHHRELFNQGLPITFFVWNIFESTEGRAGADDCLRFLRDNNMSTRAHALIWERPDVMPNDVNALIAAGDRNGLRTRIRRYITDTVTQYKGRVDEWVIENEAVDNHTIRDVLGEASIAEWFAVAHEADPSAKLMLNENRVEGLYPDKLDRLLELVRIIESNGGHLDTIGIQGHAGAVVAMDTMIARYERLAATGKALAITEYDFETEDEALRADYTRDVMTVVFSQPSFTGFTFWRFWDGRPFKHESPVYAHDWSLRPSGQVYKDLVFRDWWTNADGNTDAQGSFTTRGFLGSYQIVVTSGAQSTEILADVSVAGANACLVRLNN